MSVYLSIIYLSIMEYCSTIKKNEVLPFSAMWMDLENIMLSEISHTEKDKYYMILIIYEI